MKKTNYKNIKSIIVFVVLTITLLSYQNAFASSISEDKLGNLLNQERSARSLNTLEWNSKLYKAANNKADHMIKNNYFEHYSPIGVSPWDFIHSAGYDYRYAGENLAMGFVTSEATHDAWMASPLHKENILNPNYSDYAIAATTGEINGEDTTIVVQMFGKSDTSILSKANKLVTNILDFILGNKSTLAKF